MYTYCYDIINKQNKELLKLKDYLINENHNIIYKQSINKKNNIPHINLDKHYRFNQRSIDIQDNKKHKKDSIIVNAIPDINSNMPLNIHKEMMPIVIKDISKLLDNKSIQNIQLLKNIIYELIMDRKNKYDNKLLFYFNNISVWNRLMENDRPNYSIDEIKLINTKLNET